MYTSMYIYIYIDLCLYTYTCPHVCVYIYIYMYIPTHKKPAETGGSAEASALLLETGLVSRVMSPHGIESRMPGLDCSVSPPD